jgi:hypothetical protein
LASSHRWDATAVTASLRASPYPHQHTFAWRRKFPFFAKTPFQLILGRNLFDRPSFAGMAVSTISECRRKAARSWRKAEEAVDAELKTSWREIAADWEMLARMKLASQLAGEQQR